MPTYDNATPQGNDQIATTQPLILGNFEFLALAIGQEHNFDSSDPTQTYHLQASMPNQVDPVALPAGTNGIYYVSGGLPKFYNGTAKFLSTGALPQNILTGSVALTTSPAIVVALPASSVGNFYMIAPSSIGTAAYAVAGFVTSSTSIGFAPILDPGITLNGSGFNLIAQVNSSGNAGTYKYVVVYYTP